MSNSFYIFLEACLARHLGSCRRGLRPRRADAPVAGRAGTQPGRSGPGPACLLLGPSRPQTPGHFFLGEKVTKTPPGSPRTPFCPIGPDGICCCAATESANPPGIRSAAGCSSDFACRPFEGIEVAGFLCPTACLFGKAGRLLKQKTAMSLSTRGDSRSA